jgi:hypothetical protein
MRNTRRGFVIGGAAGLTALMAPNVAQACFCCRRRRHAAAQVRYAIHCPAWLWSTQSPIIPATIAQTTPYAFTVYGTGLYAWTQVGGRFYPAIADDNNPGTVLWGHYSNPTVDPNNLGGLDALSFYASETGSHPGGSSITITVTLTPAPDNACPGRWPGHSVTYI